VAQGFFSKRYAIAVVALPPADGDKQILLAVHSNKKTQRKTSEKLSNPTKTDKC
jgi:hypothetical protein